LVLGLGGHIEPFGAFSDHITELRWIQLLHVRRPSKQDLIAWADFATLPVTEPAITWSPARVMPPPMRDSSTSLVMRTSHCSLAFSACTSLVLCSSDSGWAEVTTTSTVFCSWAFISSYNSETSASSGRRLFSARTATRFLAASFSLSPHTSTSV